VELAESECSGFQPAPDLQQLLRREQSQKLELQVRKRAENLIDAEP
jgi:hypothetical protein